VTPNLTGARTDYRIRRLGIGGAPAIQDKGASPTAQVYDVDPRIRSMRQPRPAENGGLLGRNPSDRDTGRWELLTSTSTADELNAFTLARRRRYSRLAFFTSPSETRFYSGESPTWSA